MWHQFGTGRSQKIDSVFKRNKKQIAGNNRYNNMVGMVKLKLVGVVLGLLLFCFDAHSTYTIIGCVSDDTGYLYPGPSGVNSPRGYGPAFETSPVVTAAQIGTGIYCSPITLGNCVIRTRSRCTECTGPYDYNSSWFQTDSYYEQAGKLKGFVQCPIDDYIGFILVAVGGAGFFMIRKARLQSFN